MLSLCLASGYFLPKRNERKSYKPREGGLIRNANFVRGVRDGS